MASFQLSNRAEADLLHIGAYTMSRWGEEQATRYLAEIEACARRLAERPSLGRPCDHIRSGLRRMEQGRHVLFYRIVARRVLVSRILHQSMLPSLHTMDDAS